MRTWAKQDNPVRTTPAMPEHQLAEILIKSNQYPAFSLSQRKDRFVRRARLQLDHPRDIKARLPRGLHRFARDVLVGKESGHASCQSIRRESDKPSPAS